MGERRGTKALELWCKRVTQGYDGVSIENMSTSWKDGLAFCALIHHFRPDLIDYNSLDKNDIYGNNELAFRVAENHLGIPALLDPEDMVCVEIPDRLSILTYLSQFYQTFSSQATTPVKTSPESPTTVERPRTNTGSGQNAPTKLGAGVGGCRVCNQSVFLAQRLLISGHLFHRTCFKCARCAALLSVANYYETQDGKYCCETCPDEERTVSPTVSLTTTTTQPQPPSLSSSSLVGDRRALFETLAAADCTDDVKASKKAQRPVTLRMADPLTAATVTEKAAITCSDDNDSGVVVDSDKKESSDAKTSASVTGSRETLSDVVAVVADEEGGSVQPDEDRATDSSATAAAVVSDQLPDVVPPVMSSPPPPPPPPPSLPDYSNPPDDDIADETPQLVVQIPPLSDDLKQVLELPPVSDTPVEELQLDSPEDYEIKTLSNKLLKMDYYESNKEVPVPSPRKRIKSPIKINYPESLNPFDDEEDDGNKNKKDSTNPFGSDLEDDDELAGKKNVSLNPFSSDEDENEPFSQPPLPKPRTVLSPISKPRHQTHRKQSSASSISSYSNTPRKKKPAPLPPVSRLSLGNIEYSNSMQMSSPNSLEDSSCSGSEPSSTSNQERYRLHKSTHGKWKRKKGPAPQCPIPQRRRIKPMPMEDIKQELLDIEIKQQELERQGVKLEKDIRLKCNEDLNNVDVEEMVLQLFELVNEKNELFRKHAELMYLRKQHNFEEEHAELEYQIRVLMSKPDHTKTDTEKAREEELIRRLVEVVERRNEIVENLEKDRLREAEEDRSVFNQIGTFAQDETLPCIKPVNTTVMDGKKNFSKRLLKNIKKVKSKKDKQDVASPSQSPSNSSHSKGTLKKFMTLGHSSKKLLRPKSS
ncbi:MICAL-like protein 2 [Metopolophium dirhodum]|uniref:MICAL-like protein 2 n=1 Tax=Metopolophium dirhodum TaxID=44670 RepID=UPI00298FC375|nr:MICAL-like protein 2 [Metopolophium dirhodum]XP_060879548.1 MICAL-like protein 2 [Metopolophium dirhodum]